MPDSITHYELLIRHWAVQRNIIGPTATGTRGAQCNKTLEEVRELAHAIATDNSDEARDAVGDIIVTLIIQASMWGMTLEECISSAWDQIKDRRGAMVNGTFVKENQP